MATDFDQFPVYDPISNTQTGKLTDVWMTSISTFYENLIGYLTAGGIFVPVLTTAQRDKLQNVKEGQMIYNTDASTSPKRTGELQVWQVKLDVGAWRTITTTP